MKTELRNSLSANKTLLILSLICLLLGALSCVAGEIMIPLLAGVLSALYLFDTKSKRIFSILVSVALIALNIASVLFKYAISLFAPTAIILSLILCSAFTKGQSKSDAAYVMSIISAALGVVGYLLFAMIEQGVYTLDAAMDYYVELIDSIRLIFVDSMVEIYATSGIEVTEEIVTAVFNQQINMIISYLLIGGFVISGISMKIFGAIVGLCAEDKTHIKEWRFTATRVYAYFYVILVILSLFASSADSIFAISVFNLYNIFMVIFAYVGFKVAHDLLKKRMKPFLSVVVLLGALLLFSSFAAQLLAALGVLYAMRRDEGIAGNR